MKQPRARLVLSGLLIALFILASCNLETPDPDGFNWCYIYDLTSDDYGFSFINGSYVPGVGFVADNQYRLIGGLIHDQDVYPQTVSVTIVRLLGDPPPDPIPTLNLQAVADIFGIHIDQATGGTLPEGIDTLTLTQDHEFANDHSAIINATIQGTAPFAVTQIWVGGQSGSPFDENPCDADTPTPSSTPFVATDAPTSTLAPTLTFTPTPTWSPTPTPTATATPVCPPIPFYDSGNGGYYFFEYFEGCPMGLYYAEGVGAISAEYSSEGTYSLKYAGTSGTNYAAIHIYVDPAWTISHVAVKARRVGGSGNGGLSVFYVRPDTTYVQDAAPGGLGNGTGWVTFTSFPFGGGGSTGWERIAIDAAVPGAGDIYMDEISIRLIYAPPDFTPTASVTVTPTHTYTPSETFTPGPTSTNTPLNVTPINTPNPSATGTASQTPYPITYYTPPPLGTLPPPLTPWATSTPNLTQTAEYFETGTAAPGAGPTDQYIIGGDGDDGGTGDGYGVGGIGEIGRAIIGFGSNAMNLGINWVKQIAPQVEMVIDTYNDAAPEPIPNLPNCVGNDRLLSELCAIYYILTYTIFSGGIGSKLIPVGEIIFGLVILFVIIMRARGIIEKLQEITHT